MRQAIRNSQHRVARHSRLLWAIACGAGLIASLSLIEPGHAARPGIDANRLGLTCGSILNTGAGAKLTDVEVYKLRQDLNLALHRSEVAHLDAKTLENTLNNAPATRNIAEQYQLCVLRKYLVELKAAEKKDAEAEKNGTKEPEIDNVFTRHEKAKEQRQTEDSGILKRPGTSTEQLEASIGDAQQWEKDRPAKEAENKAQLDKEQKAWVKNLSDTIAENQRKDREAAEQARRDAEAMRGFVEFLNFATQVATTYMQVEAEQERQEQAEREEQQRQQQQQQQQARNQNYTSNYNTGSNTSRNTEKPCYDPSAPPVYGRGEMQPCRGGSFPVDESGQRCERVTLIGSERGGTTPFTRYNFRATNGCPHPIMITFTYPDGAHGWLYLKARETSTWFCTDGYRGNPDCPGGQISWAAKKSS